MRLPKSGGCWDLMKSGYSELASVLRASRVKYYCILKSFYRIITGTATTLVMGHEPMSYEALKFCGSFLQFYYVNMKGPK